MSDSDQDSACTMPATRIILVEGLDGTGKSTLCRRLEASIKDSFIWRAKAPPQDETHPTTALRLWFEYQNALMPHWVYGTIILDRWWPSTLAYTEGYYDNQFEHRANMYCKRFPTPDLVVNLTCKGSTSKSRIQTRDAHLSGEESRLHHDHEFKTKVTTTLDRCVDIMRAHGSTVISIDTDTHTPEQSFEIVMKECKRLFE
jgi:thymidylate kinase